MSMAFDDSRSDHETRSMDARDGGYRNGRINPTLSDIDGGSLFLPPHDNQELKEVSESDLLITRCKHYCNERNIHNFQQILLRAQSMNTMPGASPSKKDHTSETPLTKFDQLLL